MAADILGYGLPGKMPSPSYWVTTNAIQPAIREVDTPKVTECRGCGHVGGEATCIYCGTPRVAINANDLYSSFKTIVAEEDYIRPHKNKSKWFKGRTESGGPR